MGWASGSELCDKIIRSVKRNVPDTKKRKNIYKATIRAFRDGDWDTEDECRGVDPVFDKALDEENKRLGYEFDE
jgi:hypothetical protein